MKQSITKLSGLSSKACSKWIAWAEPKGYYQYGTDGDKGFTIDNMIQFLRDHRIMKGIRWALDDDKKCDRLFEMVKTYLEA